jgi:predicted nucleotidyltransferase
MFSANNMTSLAGILSSKVKAEIFRLLFGLAGQELHLREIARQSGLNVATVHHELQHLAKLGLVETRKDGNRVCFRANDHHPLYPDIHNLVLKTTGLVDLLREALTHEGIHLAFVFGSIASGEDKAHSDVDLMVIGTISLRQLGKLLSGVAARLGREINPHVFSTDEFAKRAKERDHFLTIVLAAPRLCVIGTNHELETMG